MSFVTLPELFASQYSWLWLPKYENGSYNNFRIYKQIYGLFSLKSLIKRKNDFFALATQMIRYSLWSQRTLGYFYELPKVYQYNRVIKERYFICPGERLGQSCQAVMVKGELTHKK